MYFYLDKLTISNFVKNVFNNRKTKNMKSIIFSFFY